jgi:hypothetical protein
MPLARFAAQLRHEAIPADVRERAKLLILDTVGIAVRARHDTDSTPATIEAAKLHWASVHGDRARRRRRARATSPAGRGTDQRRARCTASTSTTPTRRPRCIRARR